MPFILKKKKKPRYKSYKNCTRPVIEIYETVMK